MASISGCGGGGGGSSTDTSPTVANDVSESGSDSDSDSDSGSESGNALNDTKTTAGADRSFLIATVRNAAGNAGADQMISESCGDLGGVAIYQGADKNENNQLEVEEYFENTATNANPKILCNGSKLDSLLPLLSAKVLATGSTECTTGGYLVSMGFDQNSNSSLDDNEVNTTLPICNNQGVDTSIKYASRAILKGTLPTTTRSASSETIANSASSIKQTRSVPGKSTRLVSSKTGSLWLSPDSISAAIKNDLKQQGSGVPKPMTKPIQVPINADGSYLVSNLPSGTNYALTYIEGQQATQIRDINLSPGQTKDMNISQAQLRPTGSIALVLQSQNTQAPLPQAKVTVHSIDKTLTTDANGALTIAGLAPGNYGLTFEAQDYVSRYTTINVKSGQPTDLGVVFLNQEFGSLSGTVSVNGLTDNSNVIVYAKSQEGSLYTSLTNTNGSYRFSALPVGSGYSVIASAHDYQSAKVDEISVIKGMASTAPRLILQRSQAVKGSIEGSVRFAQRDIMQHAGIIVSLEGSDYEAISARDGSFIMNDIPVGTYTINFSDSNHLTQSQSITVVEAAATRIDEINLEPITGAIQGQINDENNQPVANATILIKTPTTTHTTLTNNEGLFEVTGVLTGNVTIQAQKDGYGANELAVKLETANETLDLTQTPIVLTRFTLTGQVQLSGLTDHSGVSVLLIGTDIPSTVTDKNGFFTLYGVKQGQYSLQLTQSGFNTQTQVIDVKTSPFKLPDIFTLIPKVGSISGKLVLPSGFGDTQNLEASLIDTSGAQLAQSAVSSDGSYLLTNILPGEGYIVRIKGTDALGNTINVQNQANLAVSANAVVNAQDINVSLTDPNPPVIQSVTLGQTLPTNSLSQYTINPSIYTQLTDGSKALTTPHYVDLSILASDSDGDTVTYQFETDLGQIVSATSSQARWLAPEKGGLATITVTAKSNNRVATDSVKIAVNHYADIIFLSPDQLAFPDIATPDVNSLQLNQFNVRADDFEDGVIADTNINWYSSLSGLIGSGNQITSTLKPGKHLIYVEATDSQGLVTRSTKMPLTIEIPNQILLKVPNTTSTLNGKPIPTTHDLNINANSLTLQYSSSSPNVATVSATGQIAAIASGTTLVKVESVETDSNSLLPLYTTQMVVRVLDQVTDNTAQTTLGINELKQINVTPTSIANPLRIDNLPIGHYTLVLFDKQDIVVDSNVTSVIKKGGVNVSNVSTNNASKQIIHNFQVAIPGTSVELNIAPGNVTTSDVLIKAALYAGVDAQDVNGYLNLTYWDQHNEPNDSMYIAKPMALEETISSNLVESEYVDVYSFDTISGKTYALNVVNNASSFDVLNYSLGDYADFTKFQSGQPIQKGNRIDVDFTATATGKAVVHLQGRTGFKGYQYSVTAMPSTKDGLVQDKTSFEPNNTPSTAFPINLEQTITSKLSNDEAFDYYSFEAVAGETYAIDIQNLASSADLLSYQIGSAAVADELLKQQNIDIGKSSSMSFTATTTGTVVLKLHGSTYYLGIKNSFYINYDYTFVVTSTP